MTCSWRSSVRRTECRSTVDRHDGDHVDARPPYESRGPDRRHRHDAGTHTTRDLRRSIQAHVRRPSTRRSRSRRSPATRTTDSPVTVSARPHRRVWRSRSRTTTPSVCTAGGPTARRSRSSATGTCTVQADQAGNGPLQPTRRPCNFTSAMAEGRTRRSPSARSPTDARAVAGDRQRDRVVGPAGHVHDDHAPVCTSGGMNGATITLLATGPCTVQADQAGNGSYNPAPSVQQSFTVSKANQTISFAPFGAKTLAQSPVTVGATASSGPPGHVLHHHAVHVHRAAAQRRDHHAGGRGHVHRSKPTKPATAPTTRRRRCNARSTSRTS